MQPIGGGSWCKPEKIVCNIKACSKYKKDTILESI